MIEEIERLKTLVAIGSGGFDLLIVGLSANLGSKPRAGLMAYPVGPPSPNPIPETRSATKSAFNAAGALMLLPCKALHDVFLMLK